MKISILIFTMLFNFNLFAHDYHVSHTTLFYNSSSNSIEITIKVAIEDLEIAILERESQKLEIETVNESKISNKLISNYFNKHFNIMFNDVIYDYQWVGKEVSNNLHDVYLYFEIVDFHQNEESILLNLKNSIFMDISFGQKNIVLINIEKNHHNLIFTRDLKSQSIYLKKE